MSKILHITHPSFHISTINHRSVLIDSISDTLPNEEYYTSLGDISAADILTISKHFDLINFIPHGFDTTEPIYHETIILLTYLQHKIQVNNLTINPLNTFVDNTDITFRPTGPTMWVFGCSHSHGIGLLPNELRYSDILSRELNLPLKSITKPGSSTRWALRHLINASIQSDDLVIWQITTPGRISLAGTPPTELMLSTSPNQHLLEVYTDDQIYFDHMSPINYGVQYLRAKDVNFVLTSIEVASALFYDYKKEYVKYKEYCYSPGFNVDTGTDGVHFGGLSHKNLALSLLNHIHYNYDKFI